MLLPCRPLPDLMLYYFSYLPLSLYMLLNNGGYKTRSSSGYDDISTGGYYHLPSVIVVTSVSIVEPVTT